MGYLGGPLVVVLVGQAVWWWRRPVIRALAVTWVVTEVLSLGGTLLFNGHEYPAVKLPWYWVQGLPVLESVLPGRFSLVADGATTAPLPRGWSAVFADLRLPPSASVLVVPIPTATFSEPLLGRPWAAEGGVIAWRTASQFGRTLPLSAADATIRS